MARIDWIEQRLLNWVRWRLMQGSGVLGYAAVNLADADAGRDGYATAAVPTNECDAADTEEAIRALERDLQRAVLGWYLRRGGKEEAASTLGIGASTLMARIDQAHRKLAEWFGERNRLAKQERSRVEILQRGSFTP